ncbi:hypothetical protein [Azospirillum agricola]|uniref:hypothetical protein n=1 Tax=Azospirillum agricola TaxID=1720247 RepID=UPI001B3B935C|nr:hypothetical protein [Azospirillum agricola]
MYYVVPAKAANPDLARKFIEMATGPEAQAEGIVKRFNWYPGIDAQHVQAKLDEKTWAKLFTDVKPDELAAKGKCRRAPPARPAVRGRRHRPGALAVLPAALADRGGRDARAVRAVRAAACAGNGRIALAVPGERIAV